MKGRRVLGSVDGGNVNQSVLSTPISSTTETIGDIESDAVNSESLKCPICEEQMINIYQLNQHIDDFHVNIQQSPPEISDSHKPVTPKSGVTPKSDKASNSMGQRPQSPLNIDRLINSDFISKDIKSWFTDSTPTPQKRKTLNLDLFEGNKGFSLSDGGLNKSPYHDTPEDSSEPTTPSKFPNSSPLNKPKVSRAHWIKPSANHSVCKLCEKPLNVKNGIVNCRKCGELFCNDHTNYKIKLRNPVTPEVIPQYAPQGIWCKCCETCYFNKPDLVKGTDPNIVELTDGFKSIRQKKSEESQLNRDKLVKRYIRLINFLCEYHLNKKPDSSILSVFQANNEDALVTNKEKEIVGFDNWQDDTKITNCYICFSKFGFLIRKHHCRICGRIVCDDKFQERKDCSLMVPIPILLNMLSNLNYSKLVQKNFDSLTSNDSIQIRLCKNCKNDLLYDYKIKLVNKGNETLDRIFQSYYSLLTIKNNINHYLPRYETLLLSKDFNLADTNKLKDRIMDYLKDYEKSIYQFKSQFYNGNTIKPSYEKYSRLINGIRSSLILFLQENLLKFKDLNNKFKNIESDLLPKPIVEPDEDKPRLTKRQIRELREQLMVMNEQKFIIENLINDVTKQRKFDELQPLINNKQELLNEIEALELNLGEFGFT